MLKRKNDTQIIDHLYPVGKKEKPATKNNAGAKQPLTEQEKALVELLCQITINNIFKVPGK